MSEEVAAAAGTIEYWRQRAETAEAMARTLQAQVEQAEADAAALRIAILRCYDAWSPPVPDWLIETATGQVGQQAMQLVSAAFAQRTELEVERQAKRNAEADNTAIRQAAIGLMNAAANPQTFARMNDIGLYQEASALWHVATSPNPGAALLAELAAAREANRRAAIEIARLTAALRQAAQMKTILGARRIVEDAIGVAP